MIGVTVTGCDGRWGSCDESLVGVCMVSSACLHFNIGVVVCGTSGVKQGVVCPFSCSTLCAMLRGLSGVTSINLVNVVGGTGDFNIS